MAKRELDRKAAFRAALAIREMTASEWAEANDITAGHLSQVLSTGRASVKLTGKIDAFIHSALSGIKLIGSAA